jgi:hypothetical protein
MNRSEADQIETLWDRLLSRDESAIRLAFAALDRDSQQAIRAHLLRMAVKSGWHPEQRQSAQFALDTLNKKS